MAEIETTVAVSLEEYRDPRREVGRFSIFERIIVESNEGIGWENL